MICRLRCIVKVCWAFEWIRGFRTRFVKCREALVADITVPQVHMMRNRVDTVRICWGTASPEGGGGIVLYFFGLLYLSDNVTVEVFGCFHFPTFRCWGGNL